jgi:hypothetical protein
VLFIARRRAELAVVEVTEPGDALAALALAGEVTV